MHSAPRSLYVANCSLLFQELPLLQRPAAAYNAGFDSIEYWWPFESASPSERDVDAFVSAVDNSGAKLVGLNYFAGDLFGPDCGVVSLPERQAEFRDSVEIATAIGSRLKVGAFNALYGNRVETSTPEAQDELAIHSLGFAADAAATIGATVLIEAVSGPKPYPLRTAADAIAVVDRVRASGHSNVAFLLDIFHLAANGDDISAAIASHASAVAHVQIADFPGRGEPGSGTLDFDRYLSELTERGYTGAVALEYKPSTGDTQASVANLNDFPSITVSVTKGFTQ
ncbi:TIM barrel protein [Salinibacterium amurskyense]|uniref:hydroxypyruvate isomerase family protein n=1 Tax=Salinibacterium amurskyense TaxID=205941 RepID=UPI00311E06F0